ncbi:MAG: 4Fe-4S binding protein [Bacteroides sp.]|nr:4Fe-4S binding protein [Bacteroides sp.]
MLKKIRVVTAVTFFALVTLLFLDFTGTLHSWLGWVAKVQFIPALLAMHLGIVLTLVILTLLFGRIYCSVICPLGVFQDIISHISGKRKGKKNRFSYSPAVSWLRYSLLGIFIIALIAGISSIVVVLEPYSAYGRIASNLFAPFYQWGNNLFAWLAERADSYSFYSVDVWLKSGLTLAIALVTLVAVVILAWRSGRTYCNTICPVGTFLGFLSKFSLFRPAFDTGKCTKCKVCERKCKASCIDVKNLAIDHSRCVTCMNCIENCKFGAMKYVPRAMGRKEVKPEVAPESKPENESDPISRRNVLSILTTVAFASTVKAQLVNADGGLAEIEDKKRPERKTPVVPPGAESLRNMTTKCTACQLCVSVCPNHILLPSGKLSSLMQPEISYERGYCRPECTKCSEVCPAGAIGRIDTAEKSSISIGHAVWVKQNCVVNTDERQCRSCEQHCPTGAVMLVDRDPGQAKSLKIPVINKEICIGCGACEYLCPARPFSAIYVEGNVRHHLI